ncbi:uncharacterized protein TM35_000013890 [Trypanosoma theileri]|uniref:Uncharacterized protein n=1 Tax=Trypanosoma theileri TaxID=67003 RepID=A0A1X0P9A5_9TRYP|nr:uncharacterized protein TM35_000013890 [Trypanosoma theileri]ORC93512.1 hypothetical protein TM35_000013890 [Trypanosoma theileri]
MRINPIAAGTLPEDLINAIRSGTVMLTETSDSVVVFHDTNGGVKWHCKLEMGGIRTYRHQQSGASGSAEISLIATVTKEVQDPQQVQPKVQPVSGEPNTLHQEPKEGTDPLPVTPQMNASDVIQKYRNLAVKIAFFLAPGPRDHREVLKRFASDNSEALNAVLGVLTVLNSRGQRELGADGYKLVDIESYSSKAVKQKVANLALPKVAGDKSLLDRFALYADRDVMLAVCSKGIMAGLGSSKRKREEEQSDDDDDDGEHDDDNLGGGKGEELAVRQKTESGIHTTATATIGSSNNSGTDGIKNITGTTTGSLTKPMTLLTSMEQSGIRWNDGDLSKINLTMPSTVTKVLTQLKETETTAKLSGTKQVLRSMPITNLSQLTVAQTNYTILRKEYQIVYDHLKSFEDVSEAANGWIQSNMSRFSKELSDELKRWFDLQEEPQARLVVSLDLLYKAIYQLKRDIEDYVNLREWGVMT